MLKQRMITGAMVAVGIIFVLLLSGNVLFLRTVSVILSIMAVYELCRVAGYLKSKVFTGFLMVAAGLSNFIGSQLAGVLFAVGLLGGLYLMKHIQTMKTVPGWMICLTGCMAAASFGMMCSLRSMEQGFYFLTMVILIPVITDIGAFCVGKCLGRHKLAPIISPKKTWEGSIGGTVCTVVILSTAALFLEINGLIQIQMTYLTVYLLTASFIAQLGDLTFSAIKRIAGVKDYGTLLPGHGGILDRFDSLLLVIPFTIVINQYCGPLFAVI